MFGAKKRLFRNDVAKVIVRLAMPSDIEGETQRIYLLLRQTIDQYYSQNMLPLQTGMLITYNFLLKISKDKDDLIKLKAFSEFSEIFVASANAIVAENGPGELISKKINDEITTILDALSPCLVGIDDTRTFADVLSESRQHKEFAKKLME